MNDSPKIHLSPFEEQLVTDPTWLLTKNALLEKIKVVLASLQHGQRKTLTDAKPWLPEEVVQPSPKISRGENYLGLPWLVLDHPRYFDRGNIFVIRTMFWWGNFFSTTLLLSGIYQAEFCERLAGSFELLRKDDFYISHSDSPWNHHFGNDNYTALQELEQPQFLQRLRTHPFIKLAKKISLDNWDTIDIKLQRNFNLIMGALAKESL